MGNKNITTNIYKIKACNGIIRGYFCTRFIDFILKGKSLLDYNSLFSPNDYEKNDTKIFSATKSFMMKNYIALFLVSMETFEKPKLSYIFKKH